MSFSNRSLHVVRSLKEMTKVSRIRKRHGKSSSIHVSHIPLHDYCQGYEREGEQRTDWKRRHQGERFVFRSFIWDQRWILIFDEYERLAHRFSHREVFFLRKEPRPLTPCYERTGRLEIFTPCHRLLFTFESG